MKYKTLQMSLFLLFVLVIFMPGVCAQEKKTEPKIATQSEVMKENDGLPFMQKRETPALKRTSSGSFLLKTLGATFLIIGLIFFGAWGLKKLGLGNFKSSGEHDAPDLTILSSVSPGSGRTLSVVRFGERTLLVGSTAQSFTLLADESVENHSLENNPRSVAEMLAEDNISFDEELEKAEQRFGWMKNHGGQI